MRIPSSPTLKQVCRCFWCNYAKLRRKRYSFTCWCVNICDCTANTRDKDQDSDWNTLIRTLSPTSMSGVISQVPSWTSFRYASAELDPLHLHYILYPCARSTHQLGQASMLSPTSPLVEVHIIRYSPLVTTYIGLTYCSPLIYWFTTRLNLDKNDDHTLFVLL